MDGSRERERVFEAADLASDGVVGSETRVAVGHEPEMDDVDEAVSEDLGQVIDDEIGAVRAQGLVEKIQRHLGIRLPSSRRQVLEGERREDEERKEEPPAGVHERECGK
ncbi:hypothetical protein ACLOJK_023343 [Asimina triloba]